MKGRILSFRRGKYRQNTYQYLIEVPGIDSREKASQLIGRKVVWKSPSGKLIAGKVLAPHGKKGVVRVRFGRGLPGEALTQEVEIS